MFNFFKSSKNKIKTFSIVIITSKGSNATIEHKATSLSEVQQFIENAFKTGAIFTGSGYISTALIERIDIRENT